MLLALPTSEGLWLRIVVKDVGWETVCRWQTLFCRIASKQWTETNALPLFVIDARGVYKYKLKPIRRCGEAWYAIEVVDICHFKQLHWMFYVGLHRAKCFACWDGGSWENPLPDKPFSFPWRAIQNCLLGRVKVQLNGNLELLDRSKAR